MRYFLLDGTFKEDRPQGADFKAALDAHHVYWKEFIDNGSVLLSGPKMLGSGLVIIKCEDIADAEAICAADPFVTEGVQTYDIKEFKNFNGNACVKEWFDQA